MSYCRFGPDSDLYVVAVREGYQCIACKLLNEEFSTWYTDNLGELYSHILDHRDRQHRVPRRAIERIISEVREAKRKRYEQMLYRLLTPTQGFAYLIACAKIIEEYREALDELDALNWPEDD